MTGVLAGTSLIFTSVEEVVAKSACGKEMVKFKLFPSLSVADAPVAAFVVVDVDSFAIPSGENREGNKVASEEYGKLFLISLLLSTTTASATAAAAVGVVTLSEESDVNKAGGLLVGGMVFLS